MKLSEFVNNTLDEYRPPMPVGVEGGELPPDLLAQLPVSAERPPTRRVTTRARHAAKRRVR